MGDPQVTIGFDTKMVLHIPWMILRYQICANPTSWLVMWVPSSTILGSPNWQTNWEVPTGYVNIAIEHDHLQWIYPLKMVIFHSYVSLPEGTIIHHKRDGFWSPFIAHYTLTMIVELLVFDHTYTNIPLSIVVFTREVIGTG